MPDSFFMLCPIPLCMIPLCLIPVYCYATFQNQTFTLYLIPLCHFPLCHFPLFCYDWFRYDRFRYAQFPFFKLCLIPLCHITLCPSPLWQVPHPPIEPGCKLEGKTSKRIEGSRSSRFTEWLNAMLPYLERQWRYHRRPRSPPSLWRRTSPDAIPLWSPRTPVQSTRRWRPLPRWRLPDEENCILIWFVSDSDYLWSHSHREVVPKAGAVSEVAWILCYAVYVSVSESNAREAWMRTTEFTRGDSVSPWIP